MKRDLIQELKSNLNIYAECPDCGPEVCVDITINVFGCIHTSAEQDEGYSIL